MARYQQAKDAPKDNVTALPGVDSNATAEMSDDEALSKARELMPPTLTRQQAAMWEAVIPDLVKIDRVKSYYKVFLSEFVITLERMQRFREYMDGKDEQGKTRGWKYTTAGRNGVQHKSRPEAVQYNDDQRKLNSMINQLGISPATDLRFHGQQPDLFTEIY